ncbi:uncharacterized protein LOC116295341 isoform X2 [Actinia tenebrosa]|uniref:Uncharacterized protein LOC116295341 isoform X1 n=1 Tax=Actinia tenebrosa TaxID=6105 RepID=A0A6P8HUB4_ACTTE|nr:uncharacterized protein LOC116295341 isoform X1 [Actinia tenebrosa]XP_031558987.1 uncharacterized protein LOC116295341 isoform X2 [Actinia tenebrosa]XP_031558988.1 uncharacterized protein LOC116295341 isoform X2 [Actinia tenebrosa]XP_031558989.1 uncharacterized protein LOC116295341 isoform X2 [Actinia tenebrosa]XP_031558990.1 uncharacterized protein LOC116295341 isoform X2 [Actinia tenebrosa]XP_031558991.1 uncharacterized protein LOC116295341 isoform X2 [Actinia tenebrosa]
MDSSATFVSLFVLLLTAKSAVTEMSSENGLFFDAFIGRKMSLPINSTDIHQRTTNVSDKLECIFTCLGFLWCLSVNFNTTAQRDGLYGCGLLSVDRFSHSGSLIEEKSFTHLSIKNPCAEMPCLNGGTCVIQYNREDYACACRPENSGDHCENVLYLNISIRSVAAEDNIPITSCTRSMIQVNNVENCLNGRGHNIVVYNKFGVFQTNTSFDTHDSSSSGQQMKKFLEELPNESIVLIAVWDSGSTYFGDAVNALKSIGATNPNAVSQYRSSWLLVGYKGGSPSWITEKRAERYNGPCFANVKIPIPVDLS